MHTETYFPTDAPKPFVKAYQVIERDDDTVSQVLPGTSLVMAFRYKGHVNALAGSVSSSLLTIAISGFGSILLAIYNLCYDRRA